MRRLNEQDRKIRERIFALPITSLADVRDILQFMGQYCQELIPCPANDRKDDLTRGYDRLVVAIEDIALRTSAIAWGPNT